MQLKVPFRSTSKQRDQVSGDISATGSSLFQPALLIKTSIRPYCLITSSTTIPTASKSVTSSGFDENLRPCFSVSSAASSAQRRTCASVITTSNPSSANCLEIAAPIPAPAAAVIIATFRSVIIFLHHCI